MNKVNVVLSFFTLVLLLVSCKQDETPSPATYADYGRLQVGNYWIYQRFLVDTLGNGTPTDVFDSCFVEKDTLINGKSYAKISKPRGYGHTQIILFLRDSLHYIVDAAGMVKFSSEDFSTIFYSKYSISTSIGDTAYHATAKMDDKDAMVNTPSGNFVTSNFKTAYDMYPPFDFYANPRIINMRYAKDVGLVIETLPIFASIPTTYERRLVRCNLVSRD